MTNCQKWLNKNVIFLICLGSYFIAKEAQITIVGKLRVQAMH